MSHEPSSQLSPVTHCPSCGRFVGAQENCPNCNAHVSKRLPLRVLRYGAVALAVFGLLALWFVARRVDIPAIRIRDALNTMNWAYVRLRGMVIRTPAYDDQSGYLSFWLDDGSGQMMVSAYRQESQALIAANGVPSTGDVVTVAGTLKVKKDLVSLVVGIPEHVSVERPAPVEMMIGDITAQDACRGMDCKKVVVEAQVRERRSPYDGLVVLVVRDRTGEIGVTYTADLIRLNGEPIRVVAGESVRVRGAVSLYGETPQIVLDRSDGLSRLSQSIEIAVRKAASELVSQDIDRMVQVAGAIVHVQQMSTGVKCMLDDGSGADVAVVLWPDVLDGITERADLRVGTWLDVRGIVTEYKGELELIPELPLDVVILPQHRSIGEEQLPTSIPTATPEPTTEPASTETPVPTTTPIPTLAMTPTPAAAPTATPVPPTLTMTPTPGVRMVSTGALNASQIGQQVTIEGRIVEATSLSAGVKFYLDDGSGRVALWVPQALYVQLVDMAQFVVGNTVRATGGVQDYEGELEVVPRATDDVVIIAIVAPEDTILTRIGDLAAVDVDRIVTIEGQVIEINPFSQGIKYLLDDGSGRVTLLLWQNIYDVVPQKERLAIGIMVRTTGKVTDYRGELQIIPGLGRDVAIK